MSRSSDRLGDRINRMRERGMPRMHSACAAANAMTMRISDLRFAVSAVVGAFAWPYAINEWLVFAGKPAAVGPLHGALIGLVPGFGQAALPVAVVTWIAMLF